MKILIALFIAPTCAFPCQSQVGGRGTQQRHVLPLTQSQVAQLPLSTRSLSAMESQGHCLRPLPTSFAELGLATT